MRIEWDMPEEEVRILTETLASVISEIGMEIANTDSQSFRESLQRRRDTLVHILGRLQVHERPAEAARSGCP